MVYLLECRICRKQFNGSTVTKFRARANNYKNTHRDFLKKAETIKPGPQLETFSRTLGEKCPKEELFLVRIFGLNAGKYGPEIAPYLDTFHVVEYYLENDHNGIYDCEITIIDYAETEKSLIQK